MKNVFQTSELESHYLERELTHVIRRDPRVLSFIQEAALDGIWYWDITLPENEWMDEKFWHQLGYDPKEMPHSPLAWQNIIHPDDLETATENFKKHCEDPNHPYDQLVRYRHKNGSTVYIRCRGIAIRDLDGKPLRMLGCHTNVTELMKTSEQLDAANKKLELKNKELEHFSYIASHDLQEPINTIQMFVNLIKEDYENQLDDECDRYLGYISDSVDRMRLLITSLLDYSRLGIQSNPEEFNCDELLKDVMYDLGDKIGKTKAEIKFKDLPVVYGYKTEIRMLFQNLIGNALKFQQPNNIPVIEIKSENKNGWTFSISDNGIGIAEKDYNKVFGIFHRLNKIKDYSGTGIGLAHCKKVVEMHKGDIWVESEIDKGSTFYFNINI